MSKTTPFSIATSENDAPKRLKTTEKITAKSVSHKKNTIGCGILLQILSNVSRKLMSFGGDFAVDIKNSK